MVRKDEAKLSARWSGRRWHDGGEFGRRMSAVRWQSRGGKELKQRRLRVKTTRQGMGESSRNCVSLPTRTAARPGARRRDTATTTPATVREERKTEHVGYCSINTTSFLHFLFSSNYSQICIATSKSPKMKVVQLFDISNFAFWTKLIF
jgi:hypothetical protein